MDEQSVNQSNTQPVVPQELLNPSPEILNPKGAGRKSVEEDQALQQKYYQIYYAREVLRLSPAEVCSFFKVSLSTYKTAKKWVRDHSEEVKPSEGAKDSIALVDNEIAKLNREIDDLTKNGTIILFPGTTQAVTKMVEDKETGQMKEVPERRLDKQQLNILRRLKMDYQRILIDIKCGVGNKAINIIGGNTIVGDVTVIKEADNIVQSLNGMADEDLIAISKILEKYGKPPDSDS